MPWIIDYQIVLEQMREQRFKSLYYNSGAFGFPDAASTRVVGWVGPPDNTIRPAALPFARPVDPPYEENLAALLVRAWLDQLSGRVWVMPASHWAYELEFGSRDWMPALLEAVGIDPGLLHSRNDAAAIEFSPDESDSFRYLVTRLLEMLLGSDFCLAFPGRPALATVHHHKQIWWTTTQGCLVEALNHLVAKPVEA